MRSSSPSPPSSDYYYDSPPSPPASLEDQVHVAYALDDIHLAKILLLRLKGIDVTDDDDPRIAAVQDEDFDFCFIPNGKLMDDRDEKAVLEMQARELQRMQERRRLDHLRDCERKWQDEKRRMREERIAVLRRKELEQRRAADELDDKRRAEDERRKARSKRVINYNCLKPSTSNLSVSDQSFVYDFMPPKPTQRSHSPTLSLHTSRRPAPPLTFDDSRTIPFTDVLKSMHGPLFPEEPTCSRHHPSHSSLLDRLLVSVPSTYEDRHSNKGKHKAHSRRSLPCPSCSSPPPLSPATSSPSSSIPRTSSWLSFRGIPSPSSTDITTPSSSPKPTPSSSWFIRPKSWMTSHESVPSPRHCHHQGTPVPLSEAPLTPVFPQPTVPISYQGNRRNRSSVRNSKDGAGVLVRRMSRFVEIARGFQSTYVSVTLFSVSTTGGIDDTADWVTRSRDVRSRGRAPPRSKLRLPGYRAGSRDVAIFLQSLDHDNPLAEVPPPRYIPLLSPFPPVEPNRTVVPDPPPYKLYFKPIPAPMRSPFRFHALSELHTMYPSPVASAHGASGGVSWRIRSVGNPAYLRLKALQNVMWKRGMRWEGVGRETALGGGRERVVGVAYEGVGRSLLGRG